jgi:hypothetical protein
LARLRDKLFGFPLGELGNTVGRGLRLASFVLERSDTIAETSGFLKLLGGDSAVEFLSQFR